MLSRIGLPLLLAAGIMGIFAVGVLGHRTPKAPPTHPPAESAAAAEPAATEKAVAPEKNPPGDIPDNQVFIVYKSKAGGYALDVPEGWARTEQGTAVTFKDKYDGEQVTLAKSAAPPTEKSVQKDQAPALEKAGRAVKILKVKTVKLRHKQSAICVVYTANSEPNPVTGKQIRLDMSTYYYYRNGTLAAVTVWAPAGADNVDQWKRISESFRWI